MLNDVDFLINFSGEIAKDGETGREREEKKERRHIQSLLGRTGKELKDGHLRQHVSTCARDTRHQMFLTRSYTVSAEAVS